MEPPISFLLALGLVLVLATIVYVVAEDEFRRVRQIRYRLARPGTRHWLSRDGHGDRLYLKKPYTRRWIERHYPRVVLTPEVSIPVTFNGVHWYLHKGREVMVPKIVYDIYHSRHDGLLENAARFKPWSSGEEVHLGMSRVALIGIGLLEPYDGPLDAQNWPIGKKEPQE